MKSKYMNFLQENIRHYAAGRSNYWLSQQSGVSEPTISALMNDGRNPTLEVIAKLADGLGVAPCDLIADPKKRPIPSDILDALEGQPDSMYDFIRITLKTMAPTGKRKEV